MCPRLVFQQKRAYLQEIKNPMAKFNCNCALIYQIEQSYAWNKMSEKFLAEKSRKHLSLLIKYMESSMHHKNEKITLEVKLAQ